MKSKTLPLLRESLIDLKKDPKRWFGAGLAYAVLQWSQDIFPFFGGAVASVFGIFIVATLFSVHWKDRFFSLILLGLLGFPPAVMWPTVASLVSNVPWTDAFSKAWAFPGLLFACLGLCLLFWSAAVHLTTENNLDRSIRAAWKGMIAEFPSVSALCLLFSALFLLSFMTLGIGFLLSAPWAMSTLHRFWAEHLAPRMAAKPIDA